MKKYLWLTALTMSLFFGACGDEGGTNAGGDDDESSSSVVSSDSEGSSSSAKKEFSSSTAKSSSSVASSSSAKSSSSSSSTTENQEGSSSSSKNSKYDFEWNVAEDVLQNPCNESIDGKIGKAWYRDDQGEFQCSYNKKYRDWEWTQIGGISSSSVKSSSSSAKSSSSSEYVPYDHFGDLEGGFYIDRNRYKQFTDSRNGRSYYYITITGKDTNKVTTSVTVMAENLNIGTMVNGADDQADDGVLERYCYKNDTTYCDQYGALYQWAEMMDLPSRCNTESCADKIQKNHQGICPEGWRLLTYNDFMIILTSEDNDSGVKGLRSSVFNGSNASGYSLVGAGLRTPYSEKFRYLNEETAWFYPEEHSSEEKNSYISYVMIGSISPDGSNDLKTYGMSVRCVMVE
ncbi:MAG: hypothetical protein MJZ25_13535 [Fibrobacter sp.]|nr:hypothetical protein [Fibrobacter sp.]